MYGGRRGWDCAGGCRGVPRRGEQPGPGRTHRACNRTDTASDQHADLDRDQQGHRRATVEARAELARTSRLRPGRRRELEVTIEHHHLALQDTFPTHTWLGRQIDDLARQVARDTQQRQDDERLTARPPRDRRERAEPVLAAARLVAPATARTPSSSGASIEGALDAVGRALEADARREAEERRIAEHPRRRTHDHARSRDDGPSIGF